eukprot:365075-Lingulodinium_polyedra.AAC.1
MASLNGNKSEHSGDQEPMQTLTPDATPQNGPPGQRNWYATRKWGAAIPHSSGAAPRRARHHLKFIVRRKG